MRKTLFAGLTVLTPDESVLSDDGAFIGRDRDTIDRFLEVGAKTHRHTGLPGLDNPELELPDVTAIPSGGAIPGSTTFTLGYTLVDQEGGETLLSPATVVTTAPPLEQPLFAPDGVADYADGGTLLADTYYYTVTFLDNEGGETPPGAWVSVEREPGFANARILISGMASGTISGSAQGWRLYRAIGGGTFDYLASGGLATNSFADDGSVNPNCDVHPPPDEVNTTNQINQLRVVLPAALDIGDATTFRLYGTNTGVFLGDVLLDAYPAASAGQTVFFTSYNPQIGAPPDRSHSIGGASQIDPDTDILDWHWKRPVAASAALPSGSRGDVRLSTDNGQFYGVLGASAFNPGDWTRLASAGGGGGAGASGIIAFDSDTTVDPALQLEFVGAEVTDQGGGVARVTITGGGGGGIGSVGTTDSNRLGPYVGDGDHIEGASALAFDNASESSGYPWISMGASQGATPDYAYVNGRLVPPAKQWASATALNLASGASGTLDVALSSFASETAFLLSVNKGCRVTMYTDDDARTADAGRAIGVEPGDDAGVLLEKIIPTASGGRRHITPSRHIYGLLSETWPAGADPSLIHSITDRFLSITNLSPTGDVLAAFGLLPGLDDPSTPLNVNALFMANFTGTLGFDVFQYGPPPTVAAGATLDTLAGRSLQGLIYQSLGGYKFRLYWADANNDEIGYTDFPSRVSALINTSGATVDAPQGLAMANGRLWWANSGGGGTGIAYAELDNSGGGDLTIGPVFINGPQDVAIDYGRDRILWANIVLAGNQPTIGWAQLDGSGGGLLDPGVSGPPAGPAGYNINGLAVDFDLDRVIYTVVGSPTNYIGYQLLDGSDGGIINTTGVTLSQAFGIIVTNDGTNKYAIWASTGILPNGPSGLIRADLINGGAAQMLSGGLGAGAPRLAIGG